VTTALFTDHYELTMVQAALASGVADRRAVFEVFTRRLPPGRRYGVVAGTGRVVDAVDRFRFGDDELSFLSGILDQRTVAWLAGYRFGGSMTGYREGELFFPGSPVLTVEGTFAEAVVLETLVLSILNHDAAVASAAARIRVAAGDRALIEMGGRRTHEEAAVAAARAAFIAGFDVTSNLEAGRRHGIPTAGTAAHAFTLAHDSEEDAFRAQVSSLGAGTTLLVDTFDTADGVRRAIAAAGPALGAVRIDSGVLGNEAVMVRRMLDDAGCPSTRIVVSGDLDEFSVARLAPFPVDGYGVGTSVVTGSGHPTAGFVFKLVSIDGRSVAKRSVAKATIGGRKHALRLLGDDGYVASERLSLSPADAHGRRARPLQVGPELLAVSAAEAREHCAFAMAELPPAALSLEPGDPALVASMVEG